MRTVYDAAYSNCDVRLTRKAGPCLGTSLGPSSPVQDLRAATLQTLLQQMVKTHGGRFASYNVVASGKACP